MIALSVLIVALSGLYAQRTHYQQVDKHRNWKDNTKLSANLTTRIAELEEMSVKVRHLLIKNGLAK